VKVHTDVKITFADLFEALLKKGLFTKNRPKIFDDSSFGISLVLEMFFRKRSKIPKIRSKIVEKS
jgi:hypothetical protein